MSNGEFTMGSNLMFTLANETLTATRQRVVSERSDLLRTQILHHCKMMRKTESRVLGKGKNF